MWGVKSAWLKANQAALKLRPKYLVIDVDVNFPIILVTVY